MLRIPGAQELLAPWLPALFRASLVCILVLSAAQLSSACSPQVCALHVLQTLVRGAGLGSALLRHATPMVALALQGLGSPCWAMRNAAIQLFSEYLSLCSAPAVPANKKGSASSRG